MIDFWANVQKTETCWNWNGPFDKDGYGRTHYNGNTSLVHRVSWILNKGAIPDGNQVLHHCDNPPCVNPDHLFLGNPKINAEDRVKKNRQAQGESLGLLMRGENHGKAKLTAKQVLDSREKQGERFNKGTGTRIQDT